MYKIFHIPTATTIYEDVDYFRFKQYDTIYSLDESAKCYNEAENRYRHLILFRTEKDAIEYIEQHLYLSKDSPDISLLYNNRFVVGLLDNYSMINLDHFEIVGHHV